MKLSLAVILVQAGVCVSALSPESSFASQAGARYRPEELVCELLPGYDISIINQEYGTSVKGHHLQTGCYLLATSPGQNAESLAVVIGARPDVLYCGLNYFLNAPEALQRSQPFLDVLGTGDYETQTATVQLDLDSAHVMATGAGASIAIVDGGLNFLHPLFADIQLTSVWDYVDNDSVAFDEPGGSCSGHGTFVAGVLSLVAPNAEYSIFRVLDTAGQGTGFDIASAVLRAVDDDCRVVNLSLGMTGEHDALTQALLYAIEHEVTVVTAAGNDSTSDELIFPFPASHSGALAIAAVDSTNVRAEFSNYGPGIDFCAPGVQVYSAFLDSSYAWWDGTSFSTPFVSGAAALLYSLDSSLMRDEIDTLLAVRAVNLDSMNVGLEGLLGHGLIDPARSLRTLLSSFLGDLNLDDTIDVADIIFLVNHIFRGGPTPALTSAVDNNCDGVPTAADIIYLVHYVFMSGPVPCTQGQD